MRSWSLCSSPRICVRALHDVRADGRGRAASPQGAAPLRWVRSAHQDPQRVLRVQVYFLPTHVSFCLSRIPHRVAHVSKYQRRLTAGVREPLSTAAAAPGLYNSPATTSGAADDMVLDAVGALRSARRRPAAVVSGAHEVGAGHAEPHLALPSQVQWFSACLVMLSLGGVQLVVPNMQGAGLMLPPAMSAQLLASALATMLVLVPRLAGNGPQASDAAAAPQVVPGEDARMRIAERIPSSPPSPVTVAAQCAPGGQALLVSAPLQIAHAGNVPHNVPPAGAPPQEESSVIPSVPPHVLALRELPVTAAQQAIVLLEALVKRRRKHVHRVLESHSVPDELRDPCNLTCGLRRGDFHR